MKVKSIKAQGERCASNVVECWICNRELRVLISAWANFAPRSTQPSIPPGSSVGKCVPAAAGKAKTGMTHFACGCNAGCACKTALCLDNACCNWAP